VIRPGAADFTEHPVALLRLQARVGSLLASRPIDRMRGGPPCPRSCRRGSLLAENCGRGGNASEQSFVSLDFDCVLLLVSTCMEGLAGANKTAGIYCHHTDALHIGGNRVDGNGALSRGREISNPDFSPLAQNPSRHRSFAEFIFKLIRNVSNDYTVFFVILRFVHERPFLSCLTSDEKKVTVQVLICMLDTLHRTRNASTDPLGHFMVDAVRMNVDQEAADEGPYHPQVPERRAFEP
jgi:hypothetical protein